MSRPNPVSSSASMLNDCNNIPVAPGAMHKVPPNPLKGCFSCIHPSNNSDMTDSDCGGAYCHSHPIQSSGPLSGDRSVIDRTVSSECESVKPFTSTNPFLVSENEPGASLDLVERACSAKFQSKPSQNTYSPSLNNCDGYGPAAHHRY